MSNRHVINEILELFDSLEPSEQLKVLDSIKQKGIPISVFKADISSLEILIKYFKEIEKKSAKEISEILKRKPSTIYNTYQRIQTKSKKELDVSDNSILIPYDIFKDRKYSIFESLVAYLKNINLSISQIALLLNRNYKTVSTFYRRYRIKKND